jgi:hypothetical protein
MQAQRYVCRKHPEIILFEEVPTPAWRDIEDKRVDLGKPAYCPKCGKHYFKNECDPQPENDKQ